MDKKWIKLMATKLSLALIAALALPFTLESVHVIWVLLPSYYIAICVFLALFLEISLIILNKRVYFYYLFFLIAAHFLFSYLPEIMAWLDLSYHPDDLLKPQRLRVNYISRSMFRIVAASSIIFHLFALHRERQAMMKAKLQAELSMLKSQISPHFFFNSLNSIYSLALAKSDKTPDAIITLSDMMRYVLTDAKQEWMDISQELAYLHRYVELQSLRLPLKTKIDYQVNVEGTGRIPPMLLITFLENAFKYGTSAQQETEISIHIKVTQTQLELSTHNAIVATKKPEISTGNGIANARRRLELIYPHEHELLICESNGYYQLKLTIHLK